MSIPLQFGLFWAGDKLSYLRYLTFASLRHFHQNSKIYLNLIHKYDKTKHSWGNEKQDFETENDRINYLDKLKDLDVEIVDLRSIGSDDWCPVFQTDIGRWIWLRDEGGFYLDTDQIITKSFEDLPLDKEFIYSRYIEKQCGDYCPTGVLGMEKGSNLANDVIKSVVSTYRTNNYNSSGPFALRNAMGSIDLSRSFNSPFQYFYPINSSADVWRIYENKFSIGGDTYAVHWYGGHPSSQDFNNKYTEVFCKTSNDWISVFCRGNKII